VVAVNKIVAVSLAAILIGAGLVTYALIVLFGNQGAVNDRQAQLQDAFKISTGTQVGVASAGGLVTPPRPLPGDAIARVTVPAVHLEWIIVEGVEPDDIDTAPGHFPFSAMPGEKGNFAMAGHRERGLFWDLDKVRPGYEIVVQSRKGTFTYVVTRNFITTPNLWPQLQATPAGFTAGDKVLTMTTCNPKLDNYERLVVHAELKT